MLSGKREFLQLQKRLATSFKDLMEVVSQMNERIGLLEERVDKLERRVLEREG